MVAFRLIKSQSEKIEFDLMAGLDLSACVLLNTQYLLILFPETSCVTLDICYCFVSEVDFFTKNLLDTERATHLWNYMREL